MAVLGKTAPSLSCAPRLRGTRGRYAPEPLRSVPSPFCPLGPGPALPAVSQRRHAAPGPDMTPNGAPLGRDVIRPLHDVTAPAPLAGDALNPALRLAHAAFWQDEFEAHPTHSPSTMRHLPSLPGTFPHGQTTPESPAWAMAQRHRPQSHHRPVMGSHQPRNPPGPARSRLAGHRRVAVRLPPCCPGHEANEAWLSPR